MATNDQLKALVASHAAQDDPQFYAVAMQVAAKAARAGQATFAQELRDLVDQLRARTTPVPWPRSSRWPSPGVSSGRC